MPARKPHMTGFRPQTRNRREETLNPPRRTRNEHRRPLESERATRKPEHCTLLNNGALCRRMHGEPSQIRAYSRDGAPLSAHAQPPPLQRTPLMQSMTGLGRELLNRQAIFAYAERGSELVR